MFRKFYKESEASEEKSKKIEQARGKTLEIVGSIGTATAITSLITNFWSPESSLESVMLLTGGTILLSPPFYYGLKKIKDKLDERTQRDVYQASQLVIMLQEEHDKKRRISSTTTVFLNEILDVFETENQDFPQEHIMNVNQFLYLINSNYYEKIRKYFKEMSRDTLIRKIVEEISIYLNDTKRQEFTESDAIGALKYCIFIPEDLKREIALEFKSLKGANIDTTISKIARSVATYQKDRYIRQFPVERLKICPEFDINSGNDYYELILSYIQDPHYIEEGFGNPRDIDWNVGFLKKVIGIITINHREELLKENENYSDFNLASSLVENALMYALVNHKEQVGVNEIINTFKNWDYLPFDIKLSVLDTLFTEENIDFANHPFGISKSIKEKQPQKVIKFRPKVLK